MKPRVGGARWQRKDGWNGSLYQAKVFPAGVKAQQPDIVSGCGLIEIAALLERSRGDGAYSNKAMPNRLGFAWTGKSV